ncbi:hypothetical protein DFH08DRAFT_1054047 [Mycena albidolilacea]|uniref:F-box domain-containing protein n=1 Tax=Mycena albidolilacea TaxID=1033008 RepID=A0AAD6Z4E2_9AGAR|nr:hypothetical protein DFH08DRAFT_1054047 [Mycena albidolilacea]
MTTASLKFSNKLLLQIYPHLSLKTLISAQGVNKLWRHLVPLSDLDPTRRALLNLFLHTIRSPAFLRTRPWVLANLRPFDREAYIAALLVQLQHTSLPAEFRLWIFEWPEKAVVGCTWPGLPATAYCSTDDSNVQRMRGINLLGRAPQAPLVHTVQRLTRPGTRRGWWKKSCPRSESGSTSTTRRSISSSTRAPPSRARYTTSLRETRGTTRAEEADAECDPGYRWIHFSWIAWQYHLLRRVEQRARVLDKSSELNIRSSSRVQQSCFKFQSGISEEQWAQRLARAEDRVWSMSEASAAVPNPIVVCRRPTGERRLRYVHSLTAILGGVSNADCVSVFEI